MHCTVDFLRALAIVGAHSVTDCLCTVWPARKLRHLVRNPHTQFQVRFSHSFPLSLWESTNTLRGDRKLFQPPSVLSWDKKSNCILHFVSCGVCYLLSYMVSSAIFLYASSPINIRGTCVLLNTGSFRKQRSALFHLHAQWGVRKHLGIKGPSWPSYINICTEVLLVDETLCVDRILPTSVSVVLRNLSRIVTEKWVPSITPTHWRKPHQNSSTTSCTSILCGNIKKIGLSVAQRHVSHPLQSCTLCFYVIAIRPCVRILVS